MNSHSAAQAGNTLAILAAGIAVLALLASVVLHRIADRPDEIRASRAMLDIRALESALKLYRLDNNDYPTSAQGLQALTVKPDAAPLPANWNPKGYLDGHSLPRDPWGRPYLYRSPGTAGRDYEIVSLGADGKAGGTGTARDISSFEPSLN